LSGEVEIVLPQEHVRLGVGHFFGEVAVLQRTRRSATAVAVTRARLLVLDARDLRALMDRDRRIAGRVREMARGRLKRELVTPKGDLVTEELEADEAPPPESGR
jgi:voltage-gated potassium channel